ncbi:MAG: cupin domain-containing protein [Patescibacteria group bacterium]
MKKGFFINIEEATLKNENYRKVLYTTSESQLVLMCLQPGDEIGEEVHDLDQFIRFESGSGEVMVNEQIYVVEDGSAVVVPAGCNHNVTNTGTEPLKLYTVYTEPEHKDGLIEPTKADEVEEHFDGKTTE